MDEQKVKQLIQEALSNLFASDRYIFHKTIQILNGRNIQLGNTNGTKIGTASTELLGFYGATPVNKPDTVADASAQGGTYNQNNVQSIADAVNALIDRLQELGLIT